jgi:hypothetical protein
MDDTTTARDLCGIKLPDKPAGLAGWLPQHPAVLPHHCLHCLYCLYCLYHHRSVLWGRSVFSSIRKFLQFQLTVNFVALVVSFVGALVGGRMPLNVLQLLWVRCNGCLDPWWRLLHVHMMSAKICMYACMPKYVCVCTHSTPLCTACHHGQHPACVPSSTGTARHTLPTARSPLHCRIMQVNLIMDTMGALALATETPSPKLLDDKPAGRSVRHRH